MAGRPDRGGRPSRISVPSARGRRVVVPVVVLVVVLGLLAVVLVRGRPDEGSSAGSSRGSTPDSSFTAPSGVLLARPSSPEEDNTTLQVLLDLVRNVPQRERIRLVAHSFSFVPAAEELVAAHRRGVEVQVVVDAGISGGFKAAGLLRDELGTDRTSSSFVYFAPGQLHQKTWSFTRTGSSRDVTLVGSMNITYESARQYTDVVSYVGRRDVRRVFDRRFVRLVRELPDVSPAGSVRLGRDRAWFYPGYDKGSDPVLRQLAAVPPLGARIRVVMYAWLDGRGLALARLLKDKDSAGAEVQVVLGPSVGPSVRAVLEGSGIDVRPGVFDGGDVVHHKLTLVRYPGPPDAAGTAVTAGATVRFVLTGSDNFTDASLDRPELLLRVGGASRYARYDRWVDRLVARGRTETR